MQSSVHGSEEEAYLFSWQSLSLQRLWGNRVQLPAWRKERQHLAFLPIAVPFEGWFFPFWLRHLSLSSIYLRSTVTLSSLFCDNKPCSVLSIWCIILSSLNDDLHEPLIHTTTAIWNGPFFNTHHYTPTGGYFGPSTKKQEEAAEHLCVNSFVI